MTADLTVFMNDWLSENLNFSGYPQEEVPDPEAERLARLCTAAAETEGFSKAQIEAEFGDLPAFMHRCLESAADDEVERRAERDD